MEISWLSILTESLKNTESQRSEERSLRAEKEHGHEGSDWWETARNQSGKRESEPGREKGPENRGPWQPASGLRLFL